MRKIYFLNFETDYLAKNNRHSKILIYIFIKECIYKTDVKLQQFKDCTN